MKKYLYLILITVASAQPSRIELSSHFSPTLRTTKYFNIFFPEGYDMETNRYPVIYLFRGHEREWANSSEDASRRGNIKTVFDSLYAKKKIGKMILVMPGMSAPAPLIEYTYIVNDLIPYIDTTYRPIPSKWKRAMDGFSLGGLIVTSFLARVPYLFASAGSYDGTLSLFDKSLFLNADPTLIYQIKSVQLLYHTAVQGGNNGGVNTETFSIFNSKGIYNYFPTLPLLSEAQHNWYYADYHMATTLPLHWIKLFNAPQTLTLEIKSPTDGGTYSGIVPVTWSRSGPPGNLLTQIFISSNGGKSWDSLFSTTATDTAYQWDTSLRPDGTRYKLRVVCSGDSAYGDDEIGVFTLNNPGNGTPDVAFSNISAGDTLTGLSEIQWNAADADDDVLTLNVSISFNFGETWQSVASNLTNSGTAIVNSKNLPNSKNGLLKLECTDGITSATAISEPILVVNKRYSASHIPIYHSSGHSDALIQITASDLSQLNGSNYILTFNDSSSKKSYSVFNNKGVEIVKDATELDGLTEGPLFDGMRLLIQDFPKPIVHGDSSIWIHGTSTLTGVINLLDVYTESETIKAFPSPSDYEIRISGVVVDTSLSLFGATSVPVHFTVWNMTHKKKTNFVFVEIDGNATISRHDELYLIEKDTLGNDMLRWHVQFIGNEDAINPLPNDLFKIKILKPLTRSDMYQFDAIPLSIDRTRILPFTFSLEQNYPNPFNPITTIGFSVPTAGRTTLLVFDVLGKEIATLVNEDLTPGIQYRQVFDGSNFSSGIYFIRLQSSGTMTTRKMMLLK